MIDEILQGDLDEVASFTDGDRIEVRLRLNLCLAAAAGPCVARADAPHMRSRRSRCTARTRGA
ncbi:hypothetical protein ACFO1B_40575 [Dactylosporangium siamense]|uniref:hypothetical protein n=1 Tax=Dactylosporangium siamense TaxID=685454 RepID=UPI0019420DF3|nr:hypothetical protein [Dactylosporangium siamense]